MNEKILELKRIIKESNNIVFFGGAGVSTESGIPDFRSKDGLYNQKYKYPPEYMLSHDFYVNHFREFFEFYKEKFNLLKYEPNVTHYALTKLEEDGKLKCVITQNVDGLHQKAGSKEVLELHGSIHDNYCINCGKKYDANYVFGSKGTPLCECGYIVRPNVVLYGEGLDNNVLKKAKNAISSCDTLIVGGTSLLVEPACSLIKLYFNGKNLIIINKDTTDFDSKATLVINESLGTVFKEILEEYK